MKENVKNTTKKLYTMCICLVIVMGVLFLGNSLTKGTYSVATSNVCPTGYTDNGTKCYKNMDGTFDKKMTNQSIYCSYGGTGTWSYCSQNMFDKTKYDCFGACYVDYITSTSCDEGEYWSNSQNKCITCSAGYYCEGGTTGQKICPIGYYCPAGSKQKQSCDNGKTTTTTGMDEKSDCVVASCKVGQYFNDDEKKCTTCPEGYYCEGGTTPLKSCGAGETTDGTGKTKESDCFCKGGYYLSNSQNKCMVCTAGYYCEGGTNGQTICPKGFYCPAGSSEKQSCDDGMTTTTEGMDEKSDCVAEKTEYTITLMRAEGDKPVATCTTGTDGKIASCDNSPGRICGTWTTEPLVNNTQGGTEITSSALMNKVFTSDTTYYCKAGTSIHPGGDPSNPSSNPSTPSSNPSIPSSTPSSKPSTSTPSSTPSSSTVTENPKTGSVAIFMVWVIAIGTLIYSIAYFKQSKFE